MQPLDDTAVLSLALRGGKHRAVTGQIRGGASSHLARDGFLRRDGEMEEWEMLSEPYSTPIHNVNGQRFCYTPTKLELSQDDVQLWSADTARVAGRIGELLGCRGGSEEIVPGKLWKLGPTELAIGRRSGRTVYFLASVTRDDMSGLDGIPKTGSDFIVIIGHRLYVTLDERLSKLCFDMPDVVGISENGEWSIVGSALNVHFGTPVRPKIDRNAEERERKARVIAEFFKKECFDYLNRWEELEDRRNILRVQNNLAKFTGLTPADISNIVGKKARLAGLFETAAFWQRTFLERDSYRIFEEWVEGDVKAKRGEKPDTLMMGIIRYNTRPVLRKD